MAANRMSFKLKSNKGRKPSSPGSMSGATPTNSQSSMGGTSDKHESSIDDPLINADIRSLGINEELLRETHPLVKPHLPEETSILIKDIPPTPVRSPTAKDVAVLHPLPPKAKMSKTKLLGSLKGGPRCDTDNIIVSHSIVGTVEGYRESRMTDRQATDPIPSVVPPPIPFTQLSSKKDSLSGQREREIYSRETNALNNWEKKINERKRLQEKIAKRIKGQTGDLTMNQGDTYRKIQEERIFIDRAIPKIDSGKGYHVGSEFWKLHSTVGDDVTGLKTTLTKTEKGEPPVVDFVSFPRSGSDKNDIFQRWSQSQYLKKRKDQLGQVVPEPQHPVDTDLLQVTGLVPSPPHSHRPPSSLSLDSLGEENSLSNEMTSDDDEDEEKEERNHREDSLVRSASLLASHPDVTTPPIIGPALLIDGQLLAWEDKDKGGDKLETRILFESGVQEFSQRNITLVNSGTVVINYTWKHIPHPNSLGTKSTKGTQRFYFDTKGGVILPGREVHIDYTFKSPNIGIYTEDWELVTRPVLAGGRPIIVTLKGLAFQPDLYKEKRHEIELKLRHDVAQMISRRLVDEIVDNVKTPPRSISPLPLVKTEEDEFLSKNPGVFYYYNAVQSLKSLYISLHAPHDSTTSNETINSKGRKLSSDDRNKKGGGGGGGKKEQPVKKITSEESHKDLEAVIVQLPADVPPWDLSLASLEKIILELDDADLRESKLKEFNSIIEEINTPSLSIPRSTNYIKTYFILCEAVDKLVSTSEQVRSVLGLPLSKDGLLQEEDSQADLDPSSQPSSPAIIPVQASKKDQTKKGSKKDTVKDKDANRPNSRRGGGGGGKKDSKKPAKGAGKGSKALEPDPSKDNTSALTAKPSEIDPSLLLKYNEIFQSLAYNIMGTAIDKMSIITEESDVV